MAQSFDLHCADSKITLTYCYGRILAGLGESVVVSIRVVIYKTIVTLVQFKHDQVHFNERNKAL